MAQIHKIDFLIDTEVFFKSLIEGMEVLGPSTMTSSFITQMRRAGFRLYDSGKKVKG